MRHWLHWAKRVNELALWTTTWPSLFRFINMQLLKIIACILLYKYQTNVALNAICCCLITVKSHGGSFPFLLVCFPIVLCSDWAYCPNFVCHGHCYPLWITVWKSIEGRAQWSRESMVDIQREKDPWTSTTSTRGQPCSVTKAFFTIT